MKLCFFFQKNNNFTLINRRRSPRPITIIVTNQMAQIIFALMAIVAFGYAYWQYAKIYRNISLGKDEKIDGTNSGQRWKNMFLIAFGQKKMFKRPLAAVLHLFIYIAFVFTQIELIEIVIDGLTGTHRFFYHNVPLGFLYTLIIGTIEVLSVLAFVATIVFLMRRNVLKIERFRKPELKGAPALDANLILLSEIILVLCIFLMNSADVAHSHGELSFPISSFLAPLFTSIHAEDTTLVLLERIGWWGHITMVFVLLNYLPRSKHLHIMLAFPNTYYARTNDKGEVDNMPEVQKEVASMLDPSAAFAQPDPNAPLPKFGASDIFDLSWRHLLAAYTCTECGRCTAMCPANITGKALSPRKIMMDVRDRMEEVGRNLDANRTEFIRDEDKDSTSRLTKGNYNDGKNLFDYISEAELRACTTCNACVEACPVSINPLDIIVELRRNLILEQSKSPESWNAMFNAIEGNGAPWAFPRDDRDKWISEHAN